MALRQTRTLTLQSQAVLQWPWTNQAYVTTMSRLRRVALREGLTVEIIPVEHMAPDPISRLSGSLLIRLWIVNNEEADVLSTFPTRSYNNTDQEDQEDCSICLDVLYRGSVITLNCRHEFHSDCIRRWLVDGHNSCPLCNAPALA